jgi:retron-type reverse transcriptase
VGLIQKNKYSTLSSEGLKDINLYKKAYLLMRQKEGNMTKGIDKETLDGMSIKKLEKIREEILNWKFTFKPSRRIYIKKNNGK